MDTTLGLTVDNVSEPARGLIDLPRRADKRPPEGAGILVWGPVLGLLLLGVLWLVGRALWRWVGA